MFIKGYAKLAKNEKYPLGGIYKCEVLEDKPNGDYCAIYDDSVVVIDIDSYSHDGEYRLDKPIRGKPRHEAILNYLNRYNYKYLAIKNPYTGNVHIIMKKPENFPIDGNKNNWYCALGIIIEVKVTNPFECLRVHGIEREIIYGSFEEDPDQLAPGLWPIQGIKGPNRNKCDFSITAMKEGDGRNNSFSELVFKLNHKGLNPDQVEEVATSINDFVMEYPLDPKEMEMILREETMEKLSDNSKPLGKYFDIDVFHNYFSNLGVKIRYNKRSNEIEYYGLPDEYKKHVGEKSMPIVMRQHLRIDLNMKGIKKSEVIDALIAEANENSYDPIQDYFHSLKKPTINDKEVFEKVYEILGVSDTFKQLLIKKWFVQCVAMAFNGERKSGEVGEGGEYVSGEYDLTNLTAAEGVLILSGPEGIGKTTFFEKMAHESQWFATISNGFSTSSKDDILNVLSAWILELGEIDQTFKKNEDTFKAFITEKKNRIRKPYDAEFKTIPRQTSLCGSTNKDRFLTEASGYRRFWIIPVIQINKLKLNEFCDEYLNDFWYWCYQIYKKDKNFFKLTDEELNELKKGMTDTKVQSACESDIIECFDWDADQKRWRELTAKKVREFLLKDYANNYSTCKIGQTLSQMCQYTPGMKKREGRSRQTFYLLPPYKGQPNK